MVGSCDGFGYVCLHSSAMVVDGDFEIRLIVWQGACNQYPLSRTCLIISPDFMNVPFAHPVTLQNEIALLKSSCFVNPITTMSASGWQLQFTSFWNITPQ